MAEDSSDFCFQHLESLLSEINLVTTFLQGWEQRYAKFYRRNRRSFIAVILSILGDYFTRYSRFSGHVLLPNDPLYL